MEGGFFPEPSDLPAPWEPQPAGQRHQQPPVAELRQQQQHQQQQRLLPRQPPPAGAPRSRYVPAGGPGWDAIEEEENPESRGGCSRCSSLSFNAEWLKAFGVVLCNGCKRGEALVTKSTAKQRYSVSDSDLSRLGSLRKTNPHKKDWQAMHLYMESQVARLAHDKHGGAEALAQHQQARLEARLETKLKRREEEKRREAAEEARMARVRRRIEEQEEAARQQGKGAATASGSDVEEI